MPRIKIVVNIQSTGVYQYLKLTFFNQSTNRKYVNTPTLF